VIEPMWYAEGTYAPGIGGRPLTRIFDVFLQIERDARHFCARCDSCLH